MKIKVDDKEVFEFTKTHMAVICHEIPSSIFEADVIRRINWMFMHKYEQVFSKLRKEWEPKLKAAGIKSFPFDRDEFAELVFSQPDSECRQKQEQKKLDEVNARRLKKDPNAKPLLLKIVVPPVDPSMKRFD